MGRYYKKPSSLLFAITLYLTKVPATQATITAGCNVYLNLTDDTEFGFIVPDIHEGECLVHFDFDGRMIQTYELTLFFQEYYMSLVNVSFCTDDLLDVIDIWGFSEENAIPRCTYYDMSCQQVVSINNSCYVNITIPPRRQFFHPLPDHLSDRPFFNITYYYGPQEEVENITQIQENYLAHCNFNGVPTIYEDDQGEYSLGCECHGNTSGLRCQWGRECSSTSEKELCSNHGYCRYQAGEVVCICDQDYIGPLCQNKKDLIISKGTQCGHRLNCEHYCHMWNGSPFCTCELGYIENGTRCMVSSLPWDFTLKFEGQYNSTFIKKQIHQLLEKKNVSESSIATSIKMNSSREEIKAHFTVNDTHIALLPSEDEWNAVFNTSVTWDKQKRFKDIKLTADVTESGLTLTCSVVGSPPLQFRWYKDSHLILLKDVTNDNSSHTLVEYEAGLIWIKQDVYSRILHMVFVLKNYNPNIDWGTYTCEVTMKNETNSTSSVINGMTRPFTMEISPTVVVVEKNDSLKVICTSKNMWYGGNHYSLAWKVSPDDAVETCKPRLLHWKGSEITLVNISKSVHLNCYMKDHSYSTIESVSSRILVLDLEDKYCPAYSTSEGLDLPVMVVGETIDVNCTDGFIGMCRIKCQPKGNERLGEWGDLDCSQCIYSPWNEIAKSNEVILQGRGYPYAVQDASALAEKFFHFLFNRTVNVLPNELMGVLNFLGTFITSNQNPVGLDIFVSIMSGLLEKFPLSVKSTVAMRNVIIKYLDMNLEKVEYTKLQRNLYYFRMNLASRTPVNLSSRSTCDKVSVIVSRSVVEIKSEKNLTAGIISYSNPKLQPETLQQSWSLNGVDQPVELLDSCIVDVITFPLVSGRVTPLAEKKLLINFTYNDDQQAELDVKKRYESSSYIWSKACGEILLKDDYIHWDFSRCLNSLEEESSDGSFKCQCKGNGLFGVFMKAAVIKKTVRHLKTARLIKMRTRKTFS